MVSAIALNGVWRTDRIGERDIGVRPEQIGGVSRQAGRLVLRSPVKVMQRHVVAGPNIKMRGSAYQIFERYLALAREATASGDRIAAENFYQHAEHFFRVNNARRESNQQGTPPRPTTLDDLEMNSSEADSREVDVDPFHPQWDGEDSVASETSLNQTAPATGETKSPGFAC